MSSFDYLGDSSVIKRPLKLEELGRRGESESHMTMENKDYGLPLKQRKGVSEARNVGGFRILEKARKWIFSQELREHNSASVLTVV